VWERAGRLLEASARGSALAGPVTKVSWPKASSRVPAFVLAAATDQRKFGGLAALFASLAESV